MIYELEFRKSSYSGHGQNCVEVANFPGFRMSSYDGNRAECVEVAHTPTSFRKSSYSGQEPNCVEVADLPCGAAVRDSKNPSKGHFPFPADEWSAFLRSARR
ncbi:DUF397 domain-containing protein [Nocardiopsis sp. SBT366]|uniref:DUF397 domain-containing protein n=1 Tax=Nocardiopsis sp. SBT366 TaxID=1580529 RepID=UPI00066C2D4F|nr:DUF397 domain-containing protein [Nocardiopsis sp. SBT366]